VRTPGVDNFFGSVALSAKTVVDLFWSVEWSGRCLGNVGMSAAFFVFAAGAAPAGRVACWWPGDEVGRGDAGAPGGVAGAGAGGGAPIAPPRPLVRRVSVSRPGSGVVDVACARGVGDSWDTPHRPVPASFRELFAKSAAVRTCPTAPVPHNIRRDTWDGPAGSPVRDHRIGPPSQMGGSPGAGITTDECADNPGSSRHMHMNH